MPKLILDLCGGTGSWAQPYTDAGYEVKRIDIEEGNDVRLLEYTKNVQGILAAPPCTHLSASGARWWKGKGQEALLEALSVVDACLRIVQVTKPQWWAIENPVGRLRRYLGPPVHIFNPCDYGDPYTKKTLLWGQFNIPEKTPVQPTEGSKLHRLPPTPDRWKLRSQTPQGFAKAFFKANP